MKAASYLLIGSLFIAITSCTGQNNKDNLYNPDPMRATNSNYISQDHVNSSNAGSNSANQQNYTQNRQGDNIVMHPVMDPKTNQPFSHIPLPASWKFGNGGQNEPTITGPDGLEIFYYSMQNFFYSGDSYMQQSMQTSGQQIRPPAGIESIMNNEVAQEAKKNGMTFIKQYALPQVAMNNKSYMDKLRVVGQRDYKYLAGASEWESKNGNKVLIITNYNEFPMNGMVSWSYMVQLLTCKPAAFENAKNAFINGLAKTEYNQQRIDNYNQQESGRINQSWANHNQKMQSNQSNFDAQQRAHQSTVDSWNKSSMDGYNSRSAAQERMHDQTINSIYERENVTDPNTGQQYQVEGYSNQYWMNGQGEYIPSDNSLYNPNQDPYYNDQNWEEAPVSPY